MEKTINPARLLFKLLISIAALVLISIFVSGCAKNAADPVVSITGSAFVPKTMVISAGQTITWTNNDSIPHTVTTTDGKLDSGNITPGNSYSHTFESSGEYSYYCTIHMGMTGSVTVN